MQSPLTKSFFNRDAAKVAAELLGKVMFVKHDKIWLKARIIETEAYYLHDKASHASLGYTEKRKALFMSAGTIYMYHSRGGDSLNISCRGQGNAVLIKSALPYLDSDDSVMMQANMLQTMRRLNPRQNSKLPRAPEKLCAGQVLLCRSLGLKIAVWDQKQFAPNKFYFADVGYKVSEIIQTTRLGIAKHRDAHLPYRFVDRDAAKYCTKNPLKIRKNCMFKNIID